MTRDGARETPTQHYSAQTERERLYQAAAAGGPMYTIKVPIQSGIFCTVGKGIEAKLLPPTGDFNTVKRFDRAGGAG